MRKDEEFNAWRKAIAESLPSITSRVFALRNKSYLGCGFHWGMEKRLGAVIRNACDYNEYPDVAMRIIYKVIYEGLIENLEQAEWSALNPDKDPTAEGNPWHEKKD